jgi:hypothetical protein
LTNKVLRKLKKVKRRKVAKKLLKAKKNNMSKIVTGGGVILALVLSTLAFVQPTPEKIIERVETRLGASASNEHTETQYFYGNTVKGGAYVSVSTTSATYTLSAGELRGASVIDVESTGTGSALSLTLPATTTNAYPAGNGQTISFKIKNSHTASATTTTLVAGTGVDLQEVDGGNVVIGINNYAEVECTRLDTRDVACFVTETIPAD